MECLLFIGLVLFWIAVLDRQSTGRRYVPDPEWDARDRDLKLQWALDDARRAEEESDREYEELQRRMEEDVRRARQEMDDRLAASRLREQLYDERRQRDRESYEREQQMRQESWARKANQRARFPGS